MRYVEAPEEWCGAGPDTGVFLAGGIVGCPDWQADMVALLWDTDLTLLNPRRHPWPDTVDCFEEQVRWEHAHLLRSDAVLFWFPEETLCPIVLYELGAWACRPKKIFVGCHPGYKRKRDVVVQGGLERPYLVVVDNPNDLAAQVRAWHAAKGEEH